MSTEAVVVIAFNVVCWPLLWRAFTRPKILSYKIVRERERDCQHCDPGLVTVDVLTFSGKTRTAYSNDEGRWFFWANGEIASSVGEKYISLLALEKRKAFLKKEGLLE